jgi:hypothetical protein
MKHAEIDAQQSDHLKGDKVITTFCHVVHTGTQFIIKVKQWWWARIVLGSVTTQMTSMPSTRIVWPGKASEKSYIPLVCVRFSIERLKRKKNLLCPPLKFVVLAAS